MASDGDLFYQRRACGFSKAYKIACAGGSVSDEVAAVNRAVKNALNGPFRMPSLGPMQETASRALAEFQNGLFSNDPIQGKQILKDCLNAVEHRFADLPTSHDVRSAIERVGCEAIEEGHPISPEQFKQLCFEQISDQTIDRWHLQPSEINVRKALHIDRDAIHAKGNAVKEQCRPTIVKMLEEVAASPNGRPAKANSKTGPDVNSVEGLSESLLLTLP
jgi:hypothetical protein